MSGTYHVCVCNIQICIYNIKLNLSKLYRFHSSREIRTRIEECGCFAKSRLLLTREEEKKKRISGYYPISNCPILRLRVPIRPEKHFLNFLNEQPRSSTSICPNTFTGNRTMPRSQQLTSIFHQSHAVHGRTRTFFFSLAFRSFLSFFFFSIYKKIMSNFLAQRLIHRFAISHQSPSLLSRHPKKRTVRFVQPIKSPSAINHR